MIEIINAFKKLILKETKCNPIDFKLTDFTPDLIRYRYKDKSGMIIATYYTKEHAFKIWEDLNNRLTSKYYENT